MTQHDMEHRPAVRPEDPLRGIHIAGPRNAQLTQLATALSSRRNRTGMPDRLKTGVEAASGISMDAVRVHYNSAKPAQLNALAYAQGTEIHLARGQERHLPHEAWHAVQQAQGRVRPTMMLKSRIPVNDDRALEQEADSMGLRAMRTMPESSVHGARSARPGGPVGALMQRMLRLSDLTDVAAVIQRSSETQSMPGLQSSIEKAGGEPPKRKRDDDERREGGDEKKGERRVSKRTKQVDLSRPRLQFRSTYDGVATQKLNTEQKIGFDQHATLFRPDGASSDTETLYDFRQEVRDGWASHPPAGGDQALGANFAQDGPFKPRYTNANIISAPAAIDFHDHPGFSTTAKIPAGTWLAWYEVLFQWKVRRRRGDGAYWISQPVRHRVDSAYNAGADVAVTRTSTANRIEEVQIP